MSKIMYHLALNVDFSTLTQLQWSIKRYSSLDVQDSSYLATTMAMPYNADDDSLDNHVRNDASL
jgi:hypothetical protein